MSGLRSSPGAQGEARSEGSGDAVVESLDQVLGELWVHQAQAVPLPLEEQNAPFPGCRRARRPEGRKETVHTCLGTGSEP